jgi:hypothetical protein
MPAQSTRFWETLLNAISAISTAAGLRPDIVATARELCIYVVFSTGTSAGAVVIEGCHDPTFGGTWANIATVSWATANTAHRAAITGVHRAVRVRVSVGIVGGTVSAYAVGN